MAMWPVPTTPPLCYTALINGHFYNLAGSRVGVHVAEKNFYIVNPRGIDDKVRQQAMYDFTNAIETLCEKMDLDGGITLTTYEANGFTAKFLQGVESPATGAILGVKTGFVFRRGAIPKNEYITWLHNAVDALETITEQLDGDGGITATNFRGALLHRNAVAENLKGLPLRGGQLKKGDSHETISDNPGRCNAGRRSACGCRPGAG
jgi:hypothetical protein